MILVSDDADEVLGTCQAFDEDWSLNALVRAIVLKYGNFSVEQLANNVSVERKRARSRNDMEAWLGANYSYEALTIVECLNNSFDEEPYHDTAEWKTEFSYNGKPFPVNQYLSQFGRTKIYLSESQKRLVAFVDRKATNVWVQALESVMCRLMPWYYPSDLSAEEQHFYRSIAVDNKAVSAEEKANIFVNYVNSVAELINFREMKLHRLLDGIADRARTSKMRELASAVSSEMDYIRRIQSDMANHYAVLDAKRFELTALENIEPEENDAMFRFFNTHKQVHLLDVSDDNLRFGVVDTLEFYDEDEIRTMLRKGNSYVNERSQSTVNAIKAIFVKHLGIIRVNAVFNLRSFKLVTPLKNETFVHDAMPNPHIYFYACSGGNDYYYSQYAESGDWELAIEQAISATKNFAWGDSAVGSRMLSWLENNTSEPCIYINEDLSPVERITPNMRMVSFKEFRAILEAKGVDLNG